MESNWSEHTSSEFNLIDKVNSGDSDQFAHLVRKYHPKVLGLCTSLLTNPEEAKDAAQESFIKAYQSLNSFQKRSKFSTWLYKISFRVCQDTLRKRKRDRTQSLDKIIEINSEPIQKALRLEDPSDTPLEHKDLADKILSCLSPEYRQVLLLREVQGFNYQEISEVMSCSIDSVKARLRRARVDLSSKMRHLLPPNNVKKIEANHEP